MTKLKTFWLSAAAIATVAIGIVKAPALASSAPSGGVMPMPKGPYDVRIERNVMVAMRDGTRLSTDLHMPVGATGKLPAILIRTPYDKRHMRGIGPMWGYAERIFAEHGYVVVVQDTRGRYASEGEFTVSGGDVEDTDDTINWIARQPWSSGKVGTHGCSYLGEIQIRSARISNPHWTAALAQAAGGATGAADNRYRYFAYRTGGAVELAATLNWMTVAGSKYFFRPPPQMSRETLNQYEDMFRKEPSAPEYDKAKILRELPIATLDKKAGLPPTDYFDSVARPLTDPWWAQFGYLDGSERISTPTLHMDSWPDLAVGETIFQYNLFKRNAVSPAVARNQYLIIAPTTHCAYEWSKQNTVVGERELGDTRFDYFGTYLRWFDYWLKGKADALRDMPKVQYFLMGKNEWRSADAMPIPGTRFTKLYLTSSGRANSLDGDGRLQWQPPQRASADSFVYDPANPVPTLGGPVDTDDRGQGFFDQRPVEKRPDVLVYTSAPLTSGIEVTGPLQATLYVSSTAKDTDFTVKLVDVFPDGRALNVKDGIIRARYHKGFDRSTPLERGQVYELRVDLQATATFFPAGHRLRIEVSSSNFPRFDRNLNTGGKNYDETQGVTARNTVLHSARHPSHVVLPIVPAARGK